MKDWQMRFRARWETVRSKGAVLGWHGADSPRVAELAMQYGLEWYQSRSQDEVREFMPYNADDLFNNVAGFGAKKCQRLIEILEAAADSVEDAESGSETAPTGSFMDVCWEVMKRWNVPMTYPLDLLPISTRLKNFCSQQQAKTLAHMLEIWADLGAAGMLAQDNIGRRTVKELESLARAVFTANAEVVRCWLPINDAEDGLCMRRALGLIYSTLPQQALAFLNNRLVNKMTLEESAGDFKITRERVRQYEAVFLKDISAILDWFSEEQTQMLESWMDHGEWQIVALPQANLDAEKLILAGIEAVFDGKPEGLARRLADETLRETLVEKLWRHPDLHLGGVNFQTFLDATVPESTQIDFIVDLSQENGLVLDVDNGLVKPASPCIRDTVCAILDQEDEPISLTWLSIRVQAIEGCAEGDADFILRNRYRWSQLGFLDLSKIIWDT